MRCRGGGRGFSWGRISRGKAVRRIIFCFVLIVAVGVALGQDSETRTAASQPTTQAASRPSSTSQPAEPLSEISNDDATALIRSARRAMKAKLLGKAEIAATYRPLNLAHARGVVHLQLRDRGHLIGEAQSAEMPVSDAAVAAGTLLGQAIRARPAMMQRPAIKSGGDSLYLVFEWMGPGETLAEKYTSDQRWTDELLRAFDAGREGVGLRFGSKSARTSVVEILASNYTPSHALAATERAVNLTQADKAAKPDDIAYFRFDTHVAIQKDARGRAVMLNRGDLLIQDAEVTAATVDAAIARMGAYLRYRQNPDGWFTYEFLPSSDRYNESDNPTPQVHALAALTAFAKWTGAAKDAEAARHGLDVAVNHLRPAWIEPRGTEGGATSQPVTQPAPGEQGWVFSGPDQEKVLAATAWLAIALNEGRGLNDHIGKHAGLIRAIANSQDDAGRIEMLPVHTKSEVEEDFAAAGLGLRAMAQVGGVDRREQFEMIAHRAYSYYRQRLIVDPTTTKPDIQMPDPEAAMALVRGFASAYPITQDARQSELVFKVLDALCERQITETSGATPELFGAFGARAAGDLGSDTTYYLSALNDGVKLARQIGDARREQAYTAAVRRAVRFVLQLEFRENGCFYVRSPQDVLGGIRTKLWDNRVQIDRCGEALMALMEARVILFGPRPADSQ